MSDQDFNIKVVTTADTAGLRQTEDALTKLREKARQDVGAAALFARIPPGGPPTKAPPVAGEGGGELGGFLRAVGGIAVLHEFVSQIKNAAEEINKITEALDKQGEQLVQNIQLMGEQTKFAQTQADVVKIGEAGLKNMAEQHKAVLAIQEKELTYWQQFIDSILKAGQLGAGPLQQALNSAAETSQRFADAAKSAAVFDEVTAQLNITRRAAQSYDQTVQEITAHIKEQEELQKHFGPNQLEDYVKAGRAAEGYKKELEQVKAAHEKAIAPSKAELEKRVPGLSGKEPVTEASLAVQRILQNEQAAATARAEGREKDAELFQKSADAYQRGLDPQKQKELDRIRQLQKETSPSTQPESDETKEINKALKAQGQKPITESQKQNLDVVGAIRDLETKFDRYWS